MDSRDSPGSAERSVSRNTSQMVNLQSPVHGLPIYQSSPVVKQYFLFGTGTSSPILSLRSQSPNIQQGIIPRLPQAAVISDQKNATDQFHSIEGKIGETDLMLDVKSEPQEIAGSCENSLPQQVDLISTKTVDQVNSIQQSNIPRLPKVADISKPKSAPNQCQSLSLSNNNHPQNTNTRDTISDTINLMNKTQNKPIECNTGQDGLMLAVKTEPQEITSTYQNSIPLQVVVSFSTEHIDQVNEVQQRIFPRLPLAADISKPKCATNQCLSMSGFNNSKKSLEKKDIIKLANKKVKPEPIESNIDQDGLMLAVKSEPQEIQKITSTNQNVTPQCVVVSFSTEIVEQMKVENVVKTESTDIPIREPMDTEISVVSSALEDRIIPKKELVNLTCGHASNHDGETKKDVELINLGEITDHVKTETMETAPAGKQIDIGNVKSDETDTISQSHNANNRDIIKNDLHKKHDTVTGSAGIHKPTVMNTGYISKSRDIQNGELTTNCTDFALHASYINVNTKHQPYKNIAGKVYTETEKLGKEQNTALAKMVLPNIPVVCASQSNLSNLNLSGRYMYMDKEKKKRILITLLPPKANVNTQSRPLVETSDTTTSNMPASCSSRPISVPTQLTQPKLKTMTKSSLKAQPSTIDKSAWLQPMEYSDNLLSSIKYQPRIRNVLNSSTTSSDTSLCSMNTKTQQSKTSITTIECQSKLIMRATERQEEDGHSSSSISQTKLRKSPPNTVNQKITTPLQSCSSSSNNCVSTMDNEVPSSENSKQMTGVMKTISHGADPTSWETYLQCGHCNAVFNKSRELSRHILLVHESIAPDRFYQCGKCKGNKHSFNSMKELSKHMKFYHKFGKPIFSLKDGLTRQARQKSTTPLQSCSSSSNNCVSTMDNKMPSSENSKQITGVMGQEQLQEKRKINEFICSVCSASLSSKAKLEKHTMSHLPVLCHVCGQIFENKKEYLIHFKVRRPKRQYSCSVCQTVFSQKLYLKKHMKKHEIKKDVYLCPLCGKFVSRLSLASHKRSHETSYCTKCGKRFANKMNLLAHLKRHPGKTLLECDLCGKKFGSYECLVCHIKRHIGEKLIKCDICNIQFHLICTLRRHLKTLKHLSKYHSQKRS